MILEELAVEPAALAERTGWVVKPEGACNGDLCVPLPAEAVLPGGALDARVLSTRLGMPLVHDEANDVWALGPPTVSGRALTTAVAPELVLPDLEGNPFDLASLRGRKVLLVAWASW